MQITLANGELKPAPYASTQDFCRLFREEMKGLYLLAFLLTADGPKAEQVFVSGLEDSSKGNRVFKEWARCWARRVIVQNAVRLIQPRPMGAQAGANAASVDPKEQIVWRKRTELLAILELPAFERFVFVLSVLHGYSDQDCSVFLGCTRRDVSAARSRVGGMPKFIASSSQPTRETAGPEDCWLYETGCSRHSCRAAHT